MAKLQHTFVQGKMNKDLDERLVPNGQYRDAQNVQVSTSEGSDIGAVENILGNTIQNKKDATVNWDESFGLTNAKCIGTARDTQNEKIYWFFTSDEADAVIEYDQSTGFVAPVLVDLSGVLNFSVDFLITGINVLAGLLIWTDNRNEPRIINIALFKAGSTQTSLVFDTTTQVYGRNFIDTDITVIKLKPNTQPVISMDSSLRSGFGSGLSPAFVTRNFTEEVPGSVGNWKPLKVGTSVTLTGVNDGTGISPQPIVNWQTGDIVILTAQRVNTQNFNSTYEIRFKITSGGLNPVGTIEAISQDLPFGPYYWTCVLEEASPMFEKSFPRFAYRWKYVDNEYSAFSPWTETAFLTGFYDYDSANSFNKALLNNLRKLTLDSFETSPKGVVEIDILYKDSASPVVYKVDSIPSTGTTFDITSELIYNVISSDQIIRPYDNVPKKAKSQEIIGNRIVYGNYTQNYDVSGSAGITITANSVNNTSINTALTSLKTLRTYQVGLVYLDEYGRESPVFTNDTATIILPKSLSSKRNRLSVASSQTAPSWASAFKYYIKDISNEYYNFVLDRFYDGGDGTVWLSIPSAERNKVAIDDFIILKKEHNNSTPVEDAARYKIIDISNEVPQSVANQKTQLSFSQISAGVAAIGSFQIEFTGPSVIENPLFSTYFKGGNYIRIQIHTPDGMPFSNYYEIESGGLSADTTGSYKIILTTPLGQDIGASIGANFNVYVYEDEQIAKPEYQGKFFAQINRDTVFDNSVTYTFTTDPSYYNVESTLTVIPFSLDDPANGNPRTPPSQVPLWSWQEQVSSGNTNALVNGVPQMVTPSGGAVNFGMGWLRTYDGVPAWGVPTAAWTTITENNFVQLQDSNGDWSEAFEITSVNKGYVTRANVNSPIPVGDPGAGDLQQIYYVNFTVSNPLPPNFGDGTNNVPLAIRKLTRKRGVPIDFDEETIVLTSPDPAIFETEPAEAIDLDLYYEATDAIPIANLASAQVLNYFNCYSFSNGVESNRIEDDFNAPIVGKGVKASSILENGYSEEQRGAGLIYSGIFNSTSGVNELNQFIAGLKITKDLNPIYGTIQKLHARDTDLVVLMEDKIFKVQADKDSLFNADGNSNVTSTNNVLGQSIPFVGEFGISKNPESFYSFGFRAYFTDKARGTVLRLSRDGLTEIADKGMSYYFQNELKNATGALIGSYDEDASSYNIAIGSSHTSFKEISDGWNTTLSYIPEAGISLNNDYYTFKNGNLYEHSNQVRSNFYGVQDSTTVTPIFNDAPTSIKNFKTLSYEGTAGWTADVATNMQDGEVTSWKKKESLFFNFIKGKATTLSNIDTEEFSVQGLGNVLTYNSTSNIITINGEVNDSLQAGDIIYSLQPALRVIGTVQSVDRDSNSFRLLTASPTPLPVAGNFMLFAKDSEVNTSGIIGYYAETKMTTTSSSKEELFAVNSEVFISSE